MLLREYHEATATTARYPRRGENISYPTHGLAGESGEVCEKILLMRLGEVHADGVLSELGDVLWYCSAAAYEASVTLDEVAGVTSFAELATLAQSDDRPDDLVLLGLHLAAAQGRVAERVKKVERDRGGVMDDTSQAATIAALRDLLLVTADISALLGSSLDAVAAANLVKLASRAERDLISGEGDTR